MDKIININDKLVAKVKFFRYTTGRKGFWLVDNTNNKHLMTCTVCISTSKVNDNEVMIKDYDDNAGIYNALLKQNFIFPYIRKVEIGSNKALVCKLNENYQYHEK